MGTIQNIVARKLVEHRDDVTKEFAVNLKDASRRRQGENGVNLVWSDDNKRLNEKLIQMGTRDKETGECGKVKLAGDLDAGASLDFERYDCDEKDLLPLCMAQQFSIRKNVQRRKKKKRNKKKDLRWKQKRNKKRNVFKLTRQREGRQAEQCTTSSVDQVDHS